MRDLKKLAFSTHFDAGLPVSVGFLNGEDAIMPEEFPKGEDMRVIYGQNLPRPTRANAGPSGIECDVSFNGRLVSTFIPWHRVSEIAVPGKMVCSFEIEETPMPTEGEKKGPLLRLVQG